MNPTPNPAPCAAFDDDLKAYRDGELPLLRRFQVRRHLHNCPQCREEIQLMQTLSEEIQVEESAPLDADLRAKILHRAPQVTVAPLLNRRRTVKKLGLALAGFALLVVGFNASGPFSMSSAPSPSAESSDARDAKFDAEKAREISPSVSPVTGAVVARDAVSATAPLSVPPIAMRGNANSAAQLEQRRSLARREAGDDFATFQGQEQRLSNNTKESYLENGASYAPPQRAVHREGSVTVAVDNAETASQSVAGIVQNVGGFIATNSLSTGGDGRRSATLDVRAPVEQFETLVAKIGALGTVRAKSINGQDITQRITEANARRAVLAKEFSIDQTRLREKEAKAKKSDAASISQLRAEVRTSRLRAAQSRAEWDYLKKYAALSTLYVVLQDKTKPAAGWTSGLGPTGAQAWNTFTATAKLPLQLIIWVLAYGPLWVPALIVWKSGGASGSMLE